LALPSCDAFATPFGEIPIDREASTLIADLPQVCIDDAPHAPEHSLEVQLPFLQSILPAFSLLPLAVGDARPDAVAEVIDRLWGGPETLILVSSDLSHYHDYASARSIDAGSSELVLALAPQLDHQQACGATPVNGLLIAARRRGLRARLLDLRNSGDTAGDRSRVVGYAAFAFEPQT
jgi:AmmeMemoRadiSam system protein B